MAAPQSKYSLKKGQDHLLVLQYKKAMLYKSSQSTCRNILLIVRIYENVKFNFFLIVVEFYIGIVYYAVNNK